jgi:hypothetical protein
MATDGVRWYCPNQDCNWSFVAMAASASGLEPQCVCGTSMKREDAVPVFHYLDFLRESAEAMQTEKE